MQQDSHIVVFITAPDTDEAGKIAGILLEKRLAACVNTVPGVNSIFRWQGNLESEHEILLIVKSKASRFPEIIETVKQNHSYEVPEVIALPVIGGNEDYLDWLEKEVSGPGSHE
jgi:periplasmic divalent cation tolerance protein